MYLSDFRSLIASMPTAYHSSTSKRSTWKSVLSRNDLAGTALNSIFGSALDVCISRSDLRRLATEPRLEQFVMATVLWGYPGGMRGKHVANFTKHLCPLMLLLAAARARPIRDWDTHFKAVVPIKGIKLSTYTKFLNFLRANVCGHTALILDDRIVRVARKGIFVELEPLRKLTNNNARRNYPAYLTCMHQVSNDLGVPAENTEFFLFQFGNDIKDVEENIRVRAYELYEKRGKVHGFALNDWLQAETEIVGTRRRQY